MIRPKVIQGTYAYLDREVVYRTCCPHCVHLKECAKRRAPIPDCTTVADVEFKAGGVGRVAWSGVITLKKLNSIVKEYLEGEPPRDVAMPAEQLRMEFR